MIELIDLFGAERRSLGKVPIAIGIGIASGEMVAGYAGTTQRAAYTCIGDIVNLAARLEQHTKVALRPLLVDGATRARLAAGVPAEALGTVQFKGKSAGVDVFAIGVPPAR
jgi:class 3 adenylate cyclase